MKKIFIFGKDGIGWSIDKDREHLIDGIQNTKGCTLTQNIFSSNIIIFVWWSLLDNFRFKYFKFLFKNKIIVATATNNLSSYENKLKKVLSYVNYWICANEKQKKTLIELGINKSRILYNPFYVDETTFRDLKLSRKDICKQVDIDYKLIKDKFLIGSFQRDSLGSDLRKPKWQKGPELLVQILKGLETKDITLVLAGPRRHYLINQCKKNKIPYIFVGDESRILNNVDDLMVNNLSLEKINLLYNLIDMYLVTSKSEGGPKAVIESALTNTSILSTDVGFAKEMLNKYSICKDVSEFIVKLNRVKEDGEKKENLYIKNYDKVSKTNNYDSFKKRIKKIVEVVSK
ncbi:MAG: glycosyltransferase [Candidatus Woesearchaeota archaeon]|jgi:glycosyltransferase involved in cell wall biosynthesis|nr:glycosyltransferase [Candidatus Woesearchaeota archaeon]